MKMDQKDIQNVLLRVVAWLTCILLGGTIAWKLLSGAVEQMEYKVLFILICFLIGALIFRFIMKRNGLKDQRLSRWLEEMKQYADTGISSVLIAFVIMTFLIQAFKIPSGSMIPTLQIGDHLLVNKFLYGIHIPFVNKKLIDFKSVHQLDMIVFLSETALFEEEKKKNIKKDFIKRVIGLPGDIIEIRDKIVYINELKLEEPYKQNTTDVIYPGDISFWNSQEKYQEEWEKGNFVNLPYTSIRDNFGPIKVPEDSFFVLGDNRDYSYDSRFWGPVIKKNIKGKAWMIYWPLRRFQTLN